MIAATLAPALASAACEAGGGGEEGMAGEPLQASIVYDTVAAVGQANEENPLLVYEALRFTQLIDETTVLFADSRGGRIVAIDLTDGSGWEVDDGGGDGPGEFSGHVPWLGESDGLVHTASQDGRAATWSLEGELLEANRYPEFFRDYTQGGWDSPRGVMSGGVLVVQHRDAPEPHSGSQDIDQRLRAYSPATGLAWEYELPPEIADVEVEANGTVRIRVDNGVTAHARQRTVAAARNGWLMTLGPDGTPRGRTELPDDVASVLVDADERVWVHIWSGRDRRRRFYLVFDADLADPPVRVTETGVQDAKGDHLLTTAPDAFGLTRIYLLKRRRP